MVNNINKTTFTSHLHLIKKNKKDNEISLWKSGSWCGIGTKRWRVLNVLILSSSSQVKDFIKTRTQQDVNMTFIHTTDGRQR
jgi:hypothetical protein